MIDTKHFLVQKKKRSSKKSYSEELEATGLDRCYEEDHNKGRKRHYQPQDYSHA